MSLLIEALKEAERAKEQARQSEKIALAQRPIAEAPAASLASSAEPLIEDNDNSSALFLDLDESELPLLVAEDDVALFTEPSIELFEESIDSPEEPNFSSDMPVTAEHQQPEKFSTSTTDVPPATPEQVQEKVSEITPANIRPSPVADENRAAPAATTEASNIAAAQKKAQSVFTAKRPHRKYRILMIGIFAAVTLLGFTGFGYYWQNNSQTAITFTAGTSTPNTYTPNSSSTPNVVPPQTQATEQPATAAPAATTDSSNIPSKESVAANQETAAPSQALPAPPQELPPSSSPAEANKLPAAPSAPDKTSTTVDALRAAPQPHYKPQAIRIYRETKADEIHGMLSDAYRAFNAGDLNAAQQLYQRVLGYKPNNRDALLGMAALALDRKQYEQATTYYAKILDLNPSDPEATAGLVSLQINADPAQSESYLKKALIEHPQAAAVHFALGNVYARQSRWSEAQQSYFNACSNTPDNADYAFNLAVSLDHLNQGKLALDYYQRAIAYAHNSSAGFDPSAAQTRVRALQSISGQPKP